MLLGESYDLYVQIKKIEIELETEGISSSEHCIVKKEF